MSIGFWQIVVIVILALLLFGRGRISDLMGDVAKGIKSFKRGLSEDDTISPSFGHEHNKISSPDTVSIQNVTPPLDSQVQKHRDQDHGVPSYKKFD